MYVFQYDDFLLNFELLNVLSGWNGYLFKTELTEALIRDSGGMFSSSEQEVLEKFAFEMRKSPGDTWGILQCSNQEERSLLERHSLWKPVFRVIEQSGEVLSERLKELKGKRESVHAETIGILQENERRLTDAIGEVKRFLDIKNDESVMYVSVLLPLALESYSAWAYGLNRIIFVPPARIQANHTLLTILHESCHLLLKSDKGYQDLIEKFIGDCSADDFQTLQYWGEEYGLNQEGVIEELVISALFPEGALGKVLLPGDSDSNGNKSMNTSGFESLRGNIAKRADGLVLKRSEGAMSSDEYWNQFFLLLKDFIKKP